MPEGPEVRRHADHLNEALAGKPIVRLEARTKVAREWLEKNPGYFEGKKILKVRARGKHLIGWIEGGYYFHSHLMMWGRWNVIEGDGEVPRDRRERARIQVAGATAVLYSAPVFEIGKGDPFKEVAYLSTLGPDVLPLADHPRFSRFNKDEFLKRLLSKEYRDTAVGSALLNQRIVAGVGNYLRAEILYHCKIDPWKASSALSTSELECLCEAIPDISEHALKTGMTVTLNDRRRMKLDHTLTYRPGGDYGSRYYVFRRTNLPCIECGDTIRQLRQVTREKNLEEERDEKTRIMYFCPTCQKTSQKQKAA